MKNLPESKESKGGTNLPPTTPPPPAPKGQGGSDCKIHEGQIKKCGSSPLPTTPKQEIRPPPQAPKGQGERQIVDDFSNWPKNECWSKNEMILRKLLFMEHHCEGTYSDDGEMQCGKCQIDFCRDSAEEIERKTKARNLNRMKEFLEKHKDGYFTLEQLDELNKHSQEVTNCKKSKDKFLNIESSDPDAPACCERPSKGITVYKINQMSKNDYTCKQCKLSYGWTTKTFWIPSKFAIQGKSLLIDDDMTGTQEEWVVDEVYSPELPYSYVNERSQDFKKTRKASDI